MDEGSLIMHEFYQPLAHAGFADLDFERMLASAASVFRCVTCPYISNADCVVACLCALTSSQSMRLSSVHNPCWLIILPITL